MMKNNKKAKMLRFIMLIVLICVFVVASIFVFPKISESMKEKKVEKELLLGDRYLSELDYEQAIIIYRDVIELEPENEEAYFNLAEVYTDVGDYQNAITTYNELLEYNPNNTEAYLELANVMITTDDIIASEETLKKALSMTESSKISEMLSFLEETYSEGKLKQYGLSKKVYDKGLTYLNSDYEIFGNRENNYIIYQSIGSSDFAKEYDYVNEDLVEDRNLMLFFDDYGVINNIFVRVGYYSNANSEQIRKENQIIEGDVEFEELLNASLYSCTDWYDNIHTIVKDVNQFNNDCVFVYNGYIYTNVPLSLVNDLNSWLMCHGNGYKTPLDELINMQDKGAAIIEDEIDYMNSYEVLYEGDICISDEALVLQNYCNTSDFPYFDQIELLSDDYYVISVKDSCIEYTGPEGDGPVYSSVSYSFFDENGNITAYANVDYGMSDELYYRILNWGNAINLGKNAIVTYYRNVESQQSYSYSYDKKTVAYFNFLIYEKINKFDSYQNSIDNYNSAVYMSKPWLY